MIDIKKIAVQAAAHQRSGQKSMMRTKLTIVTTRSKALSLSDFYRCGQSNSTYFPNLDEMDDWEVTGVSEEQTYFDLEYEFVRYERVK